MSGDGDADPVALRAVGLHFEYDNTDAMVQEMVHGAEQQWAVSFQTGTGQVMLERALESGVPFGWVAGDEVYGTPPATTSTGSPRSSERAGTRSRSPTPA